MTGAFEVGSVEETWALAKKLAAELKPGDVVCLEGDLGAGQTTFTQGLAAALGVPGRVTSPTFCIVQEHRAEQSCTKHWPSEATQPKAYALGTDPDTPPYSVEEAMVMLHVDADGVTIDELVRKTKLPVDRVNALVMSLRIKGFIRFLPGNRVALLTRKR